MDAQKTKMKAFCDYNEYVIAGEYEDATVAEAISKMVSNPKFANLIRSKINMEVDTSSLDHEIATCEKKLSIIKEAFPTG